MLIISSHTQERDKDQGPVIFIAGHLWGIDSRTTLSSLRIKFSNSKEFSDLIFPKIVTACNVPFDVVHAKDDARVT